MTATGRSGDRLTRRRILISLHAANTVGLVYVLASALVTNPGNNPTPNQVVGSAGATDIVQVALFVVVVGGAGHLAARAIADGALRTTEPRRGLRLPTRLAALSFAIWLLAAAAFSFANWTGQHDGGAAARLAVSIVLAGVGTSAVAFLLVERAARSLLASDFGVADAVPDRTLGVWLRLGLAWGVGSAIPLLMVAVLQAGNPETDSAAVRRGLVSVVAVGVVAGGLATAVAARSVVDPIERLLQVVLRVAGGDLDVDLVVDDGGEIGQLQNGVARMVVGLRERQHIADLFGRHVGVEVAAEALRRGVELGGQHVEVTAMFVDVIGSTALALREEPARVVELLNRLFDDVVRSAEREGGWVKFEGDGALAVFGAPISHGDHATAGLRAARWLRAALVERSGEIDTAIGVSSGVALVGNVGSERRYEFTVIGDPVNEAARITDEAKQHPHRVLASERVVRSSSIEEQARWVPDRALTLRGRDRVTQLYTMNSSPDASAD